MNRYLKLIILAGSIAMVLGLFSVFPSAAQIDMPDEVPRDKDGDPDCRECHWETFLDWEHSYHGKGLSCPECHLSDRTHATLGHGSQGGPEDCMGCHTTGYNPEDDTWQEDNIHCKACHTPVELNHPDDPMPTNRSGELCGGCHIQAFFEWQESEHHKEEVACIDCHSQHTTELRFVDAIETCAHCHQSRVDEFAHSGHEAAGVNCAACHLAPLEGPIGSGSARLNHTFVVELKTCTACHLEELHAGKQTSVSGTGTDEDHGSTNSTIIGAMVSSTTAGVNQLPRGANPFQFTAFLGLILIGIGIILGPSLLKWLPRLRKKGALDE